MKKAFTTWHADACVQIEGGWNGPNVGTSRVRCRREFGEALGPDRMGLHLSLHFLRGEVYMPWKASWVMEERLRFVGRLLDGDRLRTTLHMRDGVQHERRQRFRHPHALRAPAPHSSSCGHA
jgi:hypothetical protein